MIQVALAPLAGITDWVFRQLCEEQGCDFACTEMVSAMGYVYAPRARVTRELLYRAPGEPRLILQLFGKEERYLSRAAEELSRTGIYDGIDINMGCPAHKVAASGEGAGLMRDPENARRILQGVVKASALPVTVKMRLGWDDQHRNAVEMARMAEDCGVSGIAVHGRTRMQQYSGTADWEAIAAVKAAVRVPVLGNGDIFTPEDALERISQSGVDGVMIARGALGNPWIFGQIKAALAGQLIQEPTLAEKQRMIRRHYELLLGWKPEHIAVREMRKHIGWYLHGQRGAAQLRDRVNHLEDPAEVLALLADFFDKAEQGEEISR